MSSKIVQIVDTGALINAYAAGGEQALARLGAWHDQVWILPKVQEELKKNSPHIYDALKRVSKTLNPKITLIPEDRSVVEGNAETDSQIGDKEIKCVASMGLDDPNDSDNVGAHSARRRHGPPCSHTTSRWSGIASATCP